MDAMETMGGSGSAKRTAAVVLAVVGLVMVLAGAVSVVGLAVANRDTTTRTFDGVRVLDIEGGAGDVEVKATGDEVGGQVSVEVRRRWSWRKPAVSGRMEGGTLRLGSGCQGAFLGLCEARFLVKVPARVPLTVHTGSGNVTADGMLAGVDLRTGSGDVRGSALEGGVTANSSSGNVTVADASGDVDASGIAQDPESSHHVRATTGSCNVEIRRG